MTPANVRAAADWINRKTEWRCLNCTTDFMPSALTAWLITRYRRLPNDKHVEEERWVTHAELIDFARKLGYAPETEAKENA